MVKRPSISFNKKISSVNQRIRDAQRRRNFDKQDIAIKLAVEGFGGIDQRIFDEQFKTKLQRQFNVNITRGDIQRAQNFLISKWGSDATRVINPAKQKQARISRSITVKKAPVIAAGGKDIVIEKGRIVSVKPKAPPKPTPKAPPAITPKLKITPKPKAPPAITPKLKLQPKQTVLVAKATDIKTGQTKFIGEKGKLFSSQKDAIESKIKAKEKAIKKPILTGTPIRSKIIDIKKGTVQEIKSEKTKIGTKEITSKIRKLSSKELESVLKTVEIKEAEKRAKEQLKELEKLRDKAKQQGNLEELLRTEGLIQKLRGVSSPEVEKFLRGVTIKNIGKELLPKTEKKIITQIVSTENKILTGQTISPQELKTFQKNIEKNKITLTDKARATLDLSKSGLKTGKKVVVSPVTYGRNLVIRAEQGEKNPFLNDIKNFAKGVKQTTIDDLVSIGKIALQESPFSPVAQFNYAKKTAKVFAESKGTRIKPIEDIKKSVKNTASITKKGVLGAKQVRDFVNKNPKKSALLTGAVVGSGFTFVNKKLKQISDVSAAEYKANPALFLGQAVGIVADDLILAGAVKGVKKGVDIAGKLSKSDKILDTLTSALKIKGLALTKIDNLIDTFKKTPISLNKKKIYSKVLGEVGFKLSKNQLEKTAVNDLRNIANKIGKKPQGKKLTKKQINLNAKNELEKFEEARKKELGQTLNKGVKNKLLNRLEEINKKIIELNKPEIIPNKNSLNSLKNEWNTINKKLSSIKLDSKTKSKIKNVKKIAKRLQDKGFKVTLTRTDDLGAVKIEPLKKAVIIKKKIEKVKKAKKITLKLDDLEKKKINIFIKDTKKVGLSNQQIDNILKKPRGEAQLRAREKNLKEQINKFKILEGQLEAIILAVNIDKPTKVAALNRLGKIRNVAKGLDLNLKQIAKRVQQVKDITKLDKDEIIKAIFTKDGKIKLFQPTKTKKVKIRNSRIGEKSIEFDTDLGTIIIIRDRFSVGLRSQSLPDLGKIVSIKFKPRTNKFNIIRDRVQRSLQKRGRRGIDRRIIQQQKNLARLNKKLQDLPKKFRIPAINKRIIKLQKDISIKVELLEKVQDFRILKALANILEFGNLLLKDRAEVLVNSFGFKFAQLKDFKFADINLSKLENTFKNIEKDIIKIPDKLKIDKPPRTPDKPKIKPPIPPDKPPKIPPRTPDKPKIKPPIPPDKPPKIPTLPSLDFDSKKYDNRVILFKAIYRERKNPNKNFNKRTNPVITKIFNIKDTRNRALKKVGEFADKKAIRSIDTKIFKITDKKKRDIGRPKILNKFTRKKSKRTPVLNLVEETKFISDTRGEKRELKSLRRKKKTVNKRTIKKKVKKIKKKITKKKKVLKTRKKKKK